MRGFFGQILPVVAATYPLIVLDEPEAFLHPPQAHALGAELGRLAVERGVQILVATHDRNLLTGLLDSEVAVSVVRASRGSGQSRAFQLDADQLRELWNDPVLHYSNVLDGLFHRVVVLAEAEGDCAFLSAALDYPSRPAHAIPSGEVLFIPTGGKAAMHKVAAALKGIEVPVVAAPDLDMLANEHEIKQLFNSLGGEWTANAQSLWNRATSAQRAPREPLKIGHILDSINALFSERVDEAYTTETRDLLLMQTRSRDSAWSEVKDYGLDAFRGQARTDLESLLEILQDIGIVPVRNGELERLAPEVVARKGSGWLQAALSVSAQCNQNTQQHVTRILDAAQARLEVQTSLA